MELDELHVLQRQAGAQHHAVAVAGLRMRAGAGEIDAAITAGGQNYFMRAEAVDGAVVEIPRHQSAHRAFVGDEVEREIFDEEIHLVLHALAVKRVQHGVAGAIGRGAGALGDAFAEMGGHATESALIDLAVFGSGERHAEMLEFVDRLGRVLAEIFDGVLIPQPVRAFHRVVHVPAPVVLAHVSERGGDAALGGDRVAAGGEDFRHAGDLQSGARAFERGP